MTKSSSNPVIRPLIKFSIYGVVCLALLAVLTVQVGNLHSLPFVSHNHSFSAELTDANSLVAPDDVKIAGVTVGQVKSVGVTKGHAVVHFVVDRRIKLRQSTQVGMRFQNVIGAKFLYLYPGSSGDYVKPGWRFPLAQSVESADVGNFLTDIGAFLKALNPNDVNTFTQSIVAALQDNQNQVSQLLTNTAAVSSTVGGLDAHVGSVVDNLQKVLAALAARNSDLAAVADHLASATQQLAARNDVLDNVVTNFAEVNRQLTQVVGGNRANLDQTITNLQAIANVLAQHHTDLERGLATASQGLEPYTLISAYGQWFQIRVVYTCLAQQATCQYEDQAHPPSTLANPAPAVGNPTATTFVPLSPRTDPAPVSVIARFAINGRAGP